MSKILFISHAFPPTGGPGVQRAAKLVKYLSRRGHEITVISSPEWAYDIKDEGLLNEIPQQVKVHRTFSLEPAWLLKKMSIINFEKKTVAAVPSGIHNQNGGGNPFLSNLLRSLYLAAEAFAFTPDIYSWWLPFAITRAALAVKSSRPDVIIATGGPFSAFAVPYFINKIFDIPYIIDYRDAWTLNPYRVHNNPLKFKINRSIEREFVKNAAAVVVVTKHMLIDLAGHFPEFSEKFSVITNGFDPADFKKTVSSESAERKDNKINITYTGTFTQSRRPYFFLTALKNLIEEAAEFKDRIRLTFVGNAGDECRALVSKYGLDDITEFTGYVSHSRSVAFLDSADILLLVTGKDKSEMTGKAFEYIYSKKTIFALTNPKGDLAETLSETGTALIACHSDVCEIKRKLRALLSGEFQPHIDEKAVSRYSRIEIAGEFEKIIHNIINREIKNNE